MFKLYARMVLILFFIGIASADVQCDEKIIAIETCSIDNPIFKNLQLCYECEFAPITKTTMTCNAEYDQTEIASQWSKNYQIHLFYVKGIPIGFSVVSMQSMIDETLVDVRDLTEFYIVPLYRNSGYGKKFAHEILKQHKGIWEIRQIQPLEYTARQFWRKVILSIEHTEFKEMTHSTEWTGFIQRFRLQ